MTIKRWLRTQGSAILTSPVYRSLRRSEAALRRHLRGRQAEVHYFHQVDDPYSDLAVRALPHLAAQYKIKLVPHLVPAPNAAAAPELQRLMDWSLRDASDLARALDLTPLPWQTQPSADAVSRAQAVLAVIKDANQFATAAANIRESYKNLADMQDSESDLADKALTEGKALREKLGHYLSAMFYFEGEWYWGLDRLPYLEERLQPLRRDRSANRQLKPFVSRLEASMKPVVLKRRPVLDLYFSFRSPYSWIALPRVVELAKLYDAQLRLRFVLPMVMRGLPIPDAKRFYIVSDTKREAERVNLPFGRIADPVGKPTERGLAVLHHAIQQGKGEAFALSFMRGVFAEGINARTDTGLLKLCIRAGISHSEMRSALEDSSWRAVAEANRNEMFSQGIWGVPAFRVDGGSAHWGQDRIWLLEEQLLAAADPGNTKSKSGRVNRTQARQLSHSC